MQALLDKMPPSEQWHGAGGECGIPTHYRYRMPTPDPVEEGKYWYSFNHGPVHYIQYSTELDYGAGSEQNTCALHPAAVALLLSRDAQFWAVQW